MVTLLPPANEVVGRQCFDRCLSVHRVRIPCARYPWCIGTHCTYPTDMGPGYLPFLCPPPDLGPGYLPLHLFCLLLTPGGYHGRPVQTCSLEDLPLFVPVLTPSGGHWNTYGWQLGGTHSIRMLSCFSLQHCWPLHFHWDHPLAGRYKVRRSLCKVLNID